MSQFRYQILLNSNTSNQLSTKSFIRPTTYMLFSMYISFIFSFVYDWIDNCNRVKRMKKKKKKKWVFATNRTVRLFLCTRPDQICMWERDGNRIFWKEKKKNSLPVFLSPRVWVGLSHCCVIRTNNSGTKFLSPNKYPLLFLPPL